MCDIVTKSAAIDVSFVLALHSEAALLKRTLLSLREAARYARSEGIRVELVATLDRADELTRQVLRDFEADGFDGTTVLEVDHGSLGASRNSGIKAARGRFIYTCDGDDLISFNSISAMFRLAETVGPGHIIFHEYLCVFGERYHCWKRFPLDVVTPLAFLEQHPYSSAVLAHREIFEAVPYIDSPPSCGYAYEDWHFNAECVARGYQILVAEDTVYFYRQRSGGLLDKANKYTTRQIPPCTLFEPQTWVRITRDSYKRLGLLGGMRPPESDDVGGKHVLSSDPHLTFVRAANAIDPEIDSLILEHSTFSSNLDGPNLTAALAYHEICQVTGAQSFDEVFLLPFAANSGIAGRYVDDVIQTLYEMSPTARILIILGEPFMGGGCDRVPPNVTILDLANEWPQLAIEQRHLIVLKLIQSTAPRARLHIGQSSFSEGVYRRFKTVLQSNPSVYYRFDDVVEADFDSSFPRRRGFNFVSEYAHDLTLIVADNLAIIADDRRRIAVCTEKWRWLPAYRSPNLTEAGAVARAKTKKGRVLWSCPVDLQNHAELLLGIVRELKRLVCDIRIDVFGGVHREIVKHGNLDDLHNLSYRVASDGLSVIDYNAYDACICSPAVQAMPNVVLDAMASGLPVIAPDVGGIREIIADGDNGLLLPTLIDNDQMVAAYAAAVVRLTDESALREKLAAGALRRFVYAHSPAAFAEAAQVIFGSPEMDVTKRHRHATADPVRSFDEDECDSASLSQEVYKMKSGEGAHGELVKRFRERVTFLEEQIGGLRRAWIAEKMRLSTQSLRERTAILEHQIAELARASLAEKARLEEVQKERVAYLEGKIVELGLVKAVELGEARQTIVRLRQIESSRGYRLLQRYYALAGAPIAGPTIQVLRGIVFSIVHLIRRPRVSS